MEDVGIFMDRWSILWIFGIALYVVDWCVLQSRRKYFLILGTGLLVAIYIFIAQTL
jgi:cytochrome c oxidase subunit IV